MKHKVTESMSYDVDEFLTLDKGDITMRELAEHMSDCVDLYGPEAVVHFHDEFDYSTIEISWMRDETSTERKLREKEEAVKEKKAAVAREKKEAKERKLLQDLKDKYE